MSWEGGEGGDHEVVGEEVRGGGEAGEEAEGEGEARGGGGVGEEAAHGEGVGGEVESHHLGEDLVEVVGGVAVLLEEEKRGVVEPQGEGWIPLIVGGRGGEATGGVRGRMERGCGELAPSEES